MARRLAKVEAATEHLRTFGDLAAAYFSDTDKGRYRPKRVSSLNNEKAVYAGSGGATSQAVRAQAVIRQMLSYAVNEERLPFNCIADMAGGHTGVTRHRCNSGCFGSFGLVTSSRADGFRRCYSSTVIQKQGALHAPCTLFPFPATSFAHRLPRRATVRTLRHRECV